MSKVLAKELGPRNIRVNVVAPAAPETEGAHAIGVIGGPMVEKIVAGSARSLAGAVVLLL